MSTLRLPPSTKVSTVAIGSVLGGSVAVEAISAKPGRVTTGLTNVQKLYASDGGARLSLGYGDFTFRRLDMETFMAPGEDVAYLGFYLTHFGNRILLRALPYDSTAHRWWRIRECNGYLEAGVSADCTEWTSIILLYVPNNPYNRDLYRGLQIHLSHHGDRGLGDVVFDNLNVIPYPESDSTIPRTRTLNYMRAAVTAGFDGSGLKVAILDQGTTNIVRSKLGVQLHRKDFSPLLDLTPATGTDLNNAVGGLHGSLVATCFLRPGMSLHDIVIAGVTGSTDDTTIAWGIYLAVDNGAQVINCSFGGGAESSGGALRAAAEYARTKGVLIFFSAGNSNINSLAWPSRLSIQYPNVHSVGAFDERTDKRAPFSQYEILMTGVTPGYAVRGLLPDGTEVTWSGTSAASPHAAGLAARLLTGGTFDSAEVNTALKDTRRRPPGPRVESGGGAYDFAAALSYLLPHAVEAGVVVYELPARLGSSKRAVAGRSGTVYWEGAAAAPSVHKLSKSANAVSVMQAIEAATVFAAQQLLYLEVGIRASTQALGKGASATSRIDALSATPTASRPRKHVSGDVSTEVDLHASAYESLRWAPIPREAQEFAFTFLPTDLRFIVQDILTRKWLHWNLPIVDPEITWNLSGPFELTGTLAPPYPDIVDLDIDEWSTFIHVEYQDIILGTGILMPFSSTPDAMTIEAVGFTTYPHGIPYLETFSEFFPDNMDVIRELWRHIQSFPNGNMGILLPTGKMGVPLFGDAVYDETTGELLGYERWTLSWTDFPDCGSLIDELASSTPFDYKEVNAWKKDHSDILHGVSFGYPRLGVMRRDLRFVEGENIIEAVPIDEPDDAYASDVIVKGAGEGYNQVFAYVAATVWNRLRRVAVITDEKVTDVNMGNDLAFAELISRVLSRGISTIVVDAFHPSAPLGMYEVGDDILIEAHQPWYGNIALWHRITSVKLAPHTGLATLEVRRTDSFRFGLWSWG